jgi:hypothetical protein
MTHKTPTQSHEQVAQQLAVVVNENEILKRIVSHGAALLARDVATGAEDAFDARRGGLNAQIAPGDRRHNSLWEIKLGLFPIVGFVLLLSRLVVWFDIRRVFAFFLIENSKKSLQ